MNIKEQEGQTLVINVHLTRGLVVLLTLALLAATLVGYLAWGREEVAAFSPQISLAASTGMRRYYLTKSAYDGDGADGAGVCASGYHFVSLWEILDTSKLEYNTTLGYTTDDSGQGPPTDAQGWVRTGYNSDNSMTMGKGNCNAWTNNTSGYGTVAWPVNDWAGGTQDVHVWDTGPSLCNVSGRVWCVED